MGYQLGEYPIAGRQVALTLESPDPVDQHRFAIPEWMQELVLRGERTHRYQWRTVA